MTTVTVSIGIPTHNEESNIGKILDFLIGKIKLKKHIKIIQIIISDDSTDRTPEIVMKYQARYPFIELYHHNKRIGYSRAINEIIRHAKGDILIIFDADIVIKDPNIITYLVDEFTKDPEVGIVGGNPTLIEERGVVASISTARYYIWDYIRKAFYDDKKGNPWIFNGRCMAISRKVYSRISIPSLIGADEIIWCFNKILGYKERFCVRAVVYFKEASTLKDLIIRWKREFISRAQTKSLFKAKRPDIIDLPENFIPKSVMLFAILYALKKKPVATILCIFIYFLLKYLAYKDITFTPLHEIASSTKRIS